MGAEVLQAQFGALQERHAGAGMRPLPSGAALIEVPSLRLPAGWSRSSTSVRFLAPAGFPYANPDCFWADSGLRLASGALPQNSNETAIPETVESGLWFSWHLTQPWNPNRDSLLTWLATVRERLRIAR